MKRSLAGGLTLSALVTALLLTDGAAALAATITSDSSEAAPGETIVVSGSIDPFDIEHTVTFHWDAEDGPKLGQELVVLTYETTLTIPETATAGEHLIYACNDTCGSMAITIAVPTSTTTTSSTSTTTTTVDSTTTTTAAETTTTTANDTTTTTTTSGGLTTTTASGGVATTTDPGVGTSSPSTTVGPPITTTPESLSEGDGEVGTVAEDGAATVGSSEDVATVVTTIPDQAESSPTEVTEVSPLSLLQAPYVPPTTSTTSPATSTRHPADGAGKDEKGEQSRSEVIAAGGSEAASSGSPVMPWTAWLIAAIVASGVGASRLIKESSLDSAYLLPPSLTPTFAGARESLARFEEGLRTASVMLFNTAVAKENSGVYPTARTRNGRGGDVYALQSAFSSLQGVLLESMALAMTSWLDYYFLLDEGTRDKRLAHAARGLKDASTRLLFVEESLEDLISDHVENDALLRAYQIAISGWANGFEKISAGARLDEVVLAREGFVRMNEASKTAEDVVLHGSHFEQHPSLRHQLTVLRELHPPQHVGWLAAKRAKAPWRRALHAAGSPLRWNDLSP